MSDASPLALLTVLRDPLRERLAGHPYIEAASIADVAPEDRPRVRAVLTNGVQRIGPQEMDLLPNLGLIVTVGAGFDGVDLPAAEARGIGLLTGSGVNADDVADHAVGLVLASTRRIVADDAYVRAGRWSPGELRTVRSVGSMAVGIVGLGHIGRAIAARLAVFRCRIAWTGPRPKPDAPFPYEPSLVELARASDILIVAAPLSPDTRRLIDAEVIEALGPRGLLVNVARGGVVDEDALIAALKAGRLGSAALDVFEQEPTPPGRWADAPNVVLTPHTAGVTEEVMATVYDLAARRVTAFARDGRIPA
jgi:lactate dehydrogenase-like 2-hydroxyacid dehydrogenase